MTTKSPIAVWVAPWLSLRNGGGGGVLQGGIRRERDRPHWNSAGAVESRLSIDGAEFWLTSDQRTRWIGQCRPMPPC